MKKLILVSLIAILMFSSANASDDCNGPTELIIGVSKEFGFCWENNPPSELISDYIIYRNGQVYDSIEITNSCGAEGTDTHCDSPRYTENIPGTYIFTVVAKSNYGEESDHSDLVTLTIVGKPSKPSGCSFRIF